MRTTTIAGFITAAVFAASSVGSVQAMSPADTETPANISVDQVKAALAAAQPGHPADLKGKSLRNLDLSGVNFSNADLTGANLFGAKLAKANFTHANLTGANLNLSWLIGANFTDANLTDASLVAPVTAEGLKPTTGEVPVMKGANLTRARVQARFSGGQLQGANFKDADISAHLNNQSMGLLRTEMNGADLEGADFSNTNMGSVDLSYADLKAANLSGANLTQADLTGADAENTNFAGANLNGTDLEDAKLQGAKGLKEAKNLDKAQGYKPQTQ